MSFFQSIATMSKKAAAPVRRAGKGTKMPVRLTLLLRIAVVLFLLPQGLSLAGSPGLILGGAFPHLVASSSTYKHIDPRLAEYFHGISLYRSGQWAEAASIFEDILDKNPEFSMAAGAAADAYWRLQQTDKAHSYYALAARLCEEKLQRRAQRGLTSPLLPQTWSITGTVWGNWLLDGRSWNPWNRRVERSWRGRPPCFYSLWANSTKPGRSSAGLCKKTLLIHASWNSKARRSRPAIGSPSRKNDRPRRHPEPMP